MTSMETLTYIVLMLQDRGTPVGVKIKGEICDPRHIFHNGGD